MTLALYAQAFKKSGEIIEQVVRGFTQDILSKTFNNSLKYVEFFQQIRDIETQAYINFLCSSQDDISIKSKPEIQNFNITF